MALRNREGLRNFTAEDISSLTDLYAPYGARLMAILRHTTQNLPCLNTERGEQLRHRLEEVFLLNQYWNRYFSVINRLQKKKIVTANISFQKCGLESEFKQEYGMLKKCAVISDTAKTLGSLAR